MNRLIKASPIRVAFIFAGAAAEFALNKAVDWLYFTGKLPKDPLGRLFTTVEYARQIVSSAGGMVGDNRSSLPSEFTKV